MPSGSGCCMPASLPLGMEGPIWQPTCSPLVFIPLFCEHARVHQGALEPFLGKFFVCLFSVSLIILQFGLLSHISSLILSSGHSGPVLILRTVDAAHISLPSSHSLVVDRTVGALFHLCLLLQLGTYSVFFVFPPGCCPLRFKNSP